MGEFAPYCPVGKSDGAVLFRFDLNLAIQIGAGLYDQIFTFDVAPDRRA